MRLAGAGDLCKQLNRASDPREQSPEGCLYAAAGSSHSGIVHRIEREVGRLFPTKEPPTFPGLGEDSVVAYSYLEANVRFRIPYFQNKEPLLFTDSGGTMTRLNSFGIRPEDDYAYYALRQQPAILYEIRDRGYQLTECAIDLDRTSQPSQIVLALVKPRRTLAGLLTAVEKKVVAAGRQEVRKGLGPNDVLLVPEVSWQVTQRFAELEGREFLDPPLRGQRMDVAQQDILFRLDRGGAELKSETKLYALPVPTFYVFDRPFLIYMRKRGESDPYFVAWVDNADLLQGIQG